MPGYDQERRDELAQEHGFDSYYEYRVAYGEAREHLENIGFDVTQDQIRDEMDFRFEFDPEDNDMSRDDLREWFDEHYPDADDSDFYDWLGELYDATAG